MMQIASQHSMSKQSGEEKSLVEHASELEGCFKTLVTSKPKICTNRKYWADDAPLSEGIPLSWMLSVMWRGVRYSASF